jgi:anti-anti-sigma factor
MFIEIREHYDGICIVHCEGALVPGREMWDVQARLDEIGKLTCTRLLLDFQDVTAIGSMGVTFIVAVWKSVVGRPGGRFVLTGINPRVRRVLDLTRISTLISIAPDLASGLEIFGSQAVAPHQPAPDDVVCRPFICANNDSPPQSSGTR